MPDNEQPDVAAIANQVVNALVGDGEGVDGALHNIIKGQVEAAVKATMAAGGWEEQLAGMREAIAAGPPKETKPGPVTVDWNQLGAISHPRQMAAMLGLPDPNAHNPAAPGAQLDGKFEGFGEFLKATINYGLNRVPDERLMFVADDAEKIRADLTGQEVQLGGALVPEEFRPQLMMMMLQAASIRSRSMVIPMASQSITVPSVRDTTHANETVFGGIQFYWLEVNDEIPDSDPDFNLIRLNARALAGLSNIPNTLISDSFTTVVSLYQTMWGMGLPWKEEAAFLRGTGAGMPMGMFNADATVEVSRTTASKFQVEDLAAMEARLLPGSDARAVWMIHPSVRKELYALNSSQVQAWHPALADRAPQTLNGRPYIVNEHMSPLGTRGDVALVDWMYYLIGDRQMLSMAASEHAEFKKNQTVLRGVERIDGKPWIDSAITPAQGTETLSPFVVLGDA